jgi:hypothetical protein
MKYKPEPDATVRSRACARPSLSFKFYFRISAHPVVVPVQEEAQGLALQRAALVPRVHDDRGALESRGLCRLPLLVTI